MSHQRIIDALEAQFAAHQLLFWDDPEGEFSAWVDGLSLEGVHVLRLDRTPALQVKLDVDDRSLRNVLSSVPSWIGPPGGATKPAPSTSPASSTPPASDPKKK